MAIKKMPDDKRIAMPVAFVKTVEVVALNVLALLITEITGEAKKFD